MSQLKANGGFLEGELEKEKHLRKHYDLFIVSHNKTETIMDHLEKEQIDNQFKGIYGSDRIPVQKPDPMALQPALEAYKSRKRDEFLMIVF